MEKRLPDSEGLWAELWEGIDYRTHDIVFLDGVPRKTYGTMDRSKWLTCEPGRWMKIVLPVFAKKKPKAVAPSPVKEMLELLKSPQGYDIKLFDVLTVGRYENGQYAVNDTKDDKEYLYDRAEDALDKFFELRASYELGYDYEAVF